ncbi:MAG: ribokinase [Candidatus Methanofastidiosa archaeon]|nr:ribokinase [Candidatus Methanofastidiosa archaeon]
MISAIGNPVYDIIVTPYLDTGGRVLSGCSTNACIVLSLLGRKCAMSGCVGEDFKDTFIKDLGHFGIDYDIQPSNETGGFHLEYYESGDRKLNLLGIANPISYFPEKYLDSSYIVVGPILGEVSLELLRGIRSKTDAKIFLDPQGFVREVRGQTAFRVKNPQIKEVVENIDIVKPNEYEAEIMTGFDPYKEIDKVCDTLYSWGPDLVIVTLGEHGSVIYDGSEMLKLPAFKTFAKDPTGAGDTYMGGFIFELENDHRSLLDAGLFATCTSSIVVENIGPYFPINEQEIRRRIEILRESL